MHLFRCLGCYLAQPRPAVIVPPNIYWQRPALPSYVLRLSAPTKWSLALCNATRSCLILLLSFPPDSYIVSITTGMKLGWFTALVLLLYTLGATYIMSSLMRADVAL